MAERPAVNASPLIFLSQAGLLDLLKLEGEEIVIPRAVSERFNAEGQTTLLSRQLEKPHGSK